MALTKEERSQRAKQRIQERRENEEEMERNYPSALLNHKEDMGTFLQVRLKSDYPEFLTIRVKGNWFSPEEQYPDTQSANIPLDNPRSLARLIRGLVARYNSMVKDLNEEVENTPAMETVKIFESNGVP